MAGIALYTYTGWTSQGQRLSFGVGPHLWAAGAQKSTKTGISGNAAAQNGSAHDAMLADQLLKSCLPLDVFGNQ